MSGNGYTNASLTDNWTERRGTWLALDCHKLINELKGTNVAIMVERLRSTTSNPSGAVKIYNSHFMKQFEINACTHMKLFLCYSYISESNSFIMWLNGMQLLNKDVKANTYCLTQNKLAIRKSDEWLNYHLLRNTECYQLISGRFVNNRTQYLILSFNQSDDES